jgi:hypothetical protein
VGGSPRFKGWAKNNFGGPLCGEPDGGPGGPVVALASLMVALAGLWWPWRACGGPGGPVVALAGVMNAGLIDCVVG